MRSPLWKLYFSSAGPSGALDAALFGEDDASTDDRDEAPDSSGATRSSMLASVDRFLTAANVVRDAVMDPADVLAADHVLNLSWASVADKRYLVKRFGDHLKAELKIHDIPFSQHHDPTKLVRPELMLRCLAYMAHEEILALCPRPEDDVWHTRSRLAARRLQVRLHDSDACRWSLTDASVALRSDHIGRLVALQGSVTRASPIRPYVQRLNLTCPRCKAVVPYVLHDGRWRPPDGCAAKGCRVKALVPDRASAVCRDFQKVTLQEAPDVTDLNADLQYGRVPRTIEVELFDDLVDSCVPGDALKVLGIVKSVEVEGGRGGGGFGGKGKGQRNEYNFFIEALSVHNAKAAPTNASAAAAVATGGPASGGLAAGGGGGAAAGSPAAGGRSGITFSVRELQEIAKLHAAWNGAMFELLAASFSPAIFGHEVVKAGLLLGLFGGSTQTRSADAALVGKRADIHVLVVGDPGMGKSQMLTAASHLAPRGVYVGGSTASSSGLTVTAVRDQQTGDFMLEAGALVMGDQGCCCIDEFDKMKDSEHQALLEAMEQQSISVAKAGIVCSLPARTSILAAANPINGHYNKTKTVCENLKLPPNILSRFDLVFVLLDTPNTDMDKLLSRHIMQLHAGAAGTGAQRMADGGLAGGGRFAQEAGYAHWASQEDASLAQRLREAATRYGEGDLLPPPLLRRYIAYARAHVHPRLSDAAQVELHKFYLQLRAGQRGADSVPITARQLESLVRLAEARARMDLREDVTRQDALDAVAVVRETIVFDAVADHLAQQGTRGFGGGGSDGAFGSAAPMGMPPPSLQSRGGRGAGKVKAARDFASSLEHAASHRNSAIFTRNDLRSAIASFGQCPFPTPDDFIEYLNDQQYLLKHAGCNYRLASSSISMHGSQR